MVHLNINSHLNLPFKKNLFIISHNKLHPQFERLLLSWSSWKDMYSIMIRGSKEKILLGKWLHVFSGKGHHFHFFFHVYCMYCYTGMKVMHWSTSQPWASDSLWSMHPGVVNLTLVVNIEEGNLTLYICKWQGGVKGLQEVYLAGIMIEY